MSEQTRPWMWRNGPLLAAFVVLLVLWLMGPKFLAWAQVYPKAAFIPMMAWVGQFSKWLINDATFGLFTFAELTRAIGAVIDFPYRIVLALLATGFLEGQGSAAIQLVPPLPWWSVALLTGILGHWIGGWRLSAFAAGCMVYLALFGQWQSAMLTLSSILVAAPLGVGFGLLIGTACYRWKRVEQVVSPLLDLMQTIPVFAYLVPVLVLFGFGPTSAIVATLIFAMPPMIRITLLGLRGVPSDIHDLALMTGCTERQTMWRVLLPAARQTLMVGVNQVIMLALNMVIIASMIGAGGLGFDVLAALRRLDIGAGLEAGLAIVALALVLDRLSQGLSERLSMPEQVDRSAPWYRRYPYLVLALVIAALSLLVVMAVPSLGVFPESFQLSTGTFFSGIVEWINVNYFDMLEGLKNLVLLNVLVPFKRFLVSLPWAGVVLMLGALGYVLGGLRLALLVGVLAFLIATTGQWEKAMITVYLCGISVLVSAIIGITWGILVYDRPKWWGATQAVIDTLQTLPSFVYLMPVVMLFRVGDFSAMIAVVAFAVAPTIRYTALGLQRVDPALVEAGKAMGATPLQSLFNIRLKLALPEIMLGLNQTIMFALSMLVITALVGTRDLGQEVYFALTKADIGRGIVAGLAVAAIAIICDRLIGAGAVKARQRLGLA